MRREERQLKKEKKEKRLRIAAAASVAVQRVAVATAPTATLTTAGTISRDSVAGHSSTSTSTTTTTATTTTKPTTAPTATNSILNRLNQRIKHRRNSTVALPTLPSTTCNNPNLDTNNSQMTPNSTAAEGTLATPRLEPTPPRSIEPMV